MANTKDLAKIHGAAFYFANISRDKKRIAKHFRVSERTIDRWSKEPEWEHALEVSGYTGTRSFTQPPRRDIASSSRDKYDKARSLYIEALQAGELEHKIATKVGEAIGLPSSTIRRWAKRHRWHEDYQDSIMSNTEVVTFTGVSGTTYKFEPYIFSTEFPPIGAVYLFTKRYPSDGKLIYKPLFIGETEALTGRFCDQDKFNCVKRQGGNIICIHREKIGFLRRQKETDLITALDPICNKEDVRQVMLSEPSETYLYKRSNVKTSNSEEVKRNLVTRQSNAKRRNTMLIANENNNEILDLAVKIDLENKRHNSTIDQLVDELLVVAQRAEDPSSDVNWTPEQFANEKLNEQLRTEYQNNHEAYTDDIYRLGAEIMNFTQGWNLKCIPMVKHIFWASGKHRLFGINLFSNRPRLAVFYIKKNGVITQEDVEKFVPNHDLTAFPQYSQLRFQPDTPLTDLHALFEEVYSRRKNQ
ncbi:MAG: hypothetical protein OXD54_03515 [Candidatus Poribacteria bacterium]|nr:hypothetical protein [Candidatus Poribacteria bacterium]